MNQQQVPPPQAAPTRVRGYRLLSRIGEGGMGVVHLAQAPDGRRVALKVLRPHIIGDDESRARLAREVASLRRVASPRVAEVIDADPWGDTPYVATRYVPGPSLHEHVRTQGPILGRDLGHLAAGLAEAVIAVHQVGVLHRDIKPSNVLLEGRAPVLIDFGLARLTEDPRLTQTGWLLGTPGYFAPEILYGEDATTASDVHSWAATVVFASTGRPPFGTGPALAIMDRVRRGEHDLSGVPVALRQMVTDCLAPDPADRPEMAVVLSSLRQATPRRPRPFRPPERSHLTVPLALAPERNPPDATPTVAQRTTGQPTATSTDVLITPVLPPQRHQQPAGSPSTRPPVVRQRRRGRDVSRLADAPGSQRPGVARTQRRVLMLGLFGAVALGFALAPYLSLVVLGLLALVVRTLSWTAESARDRQRLRGRRRWYDAPLTLVSVPWYLVVATAGTVMLLVWAACAAFAVGFAYLLFGGPDVPGLVLMGGVLAVSLWWGPGSRRLRVPTRRLLRGTTRNIWLGWLGIAVVGVAVVVCVSALLTGDVDWQPFDGPPWRAGTILGSLLRWF